MPDAQQVVTDAIKALLTRRGTPGLEINPTSTLSGDLDLDSLELAELSAELEDNLGKDPYTEGIVPETVGELVGFYS